MHIKSAPFWFDNELFVVMIKELINSYHKRLGQILISHIKLALQQLIIIDVLHGMGVSI